jgi:hypothetical protein
MQGFQKTWFRSQTPRLKFFSIKKMKKIKKNLVTFTKHSILHNFSNF